MRLLPHNPSVGQVSNLPSATVGYHNRILNDGTSTYMYDLEGNRTSKTDIATGHQVEYSWNHANQLIAVVYKTYNNTVTKSVEYQYDALGRRIGKSVDDNGDSTMDRRETFVYDGAGLLADAAGSIHIGSPNGALNQAGWTDQLLFQFTDADADSSSFSPLATRYLNGPAVDQIFAVESGSAAPLWALTDHQGTPRDWVQQTTVNGNSSTTIAQHIRYTAFGTISSVVDSTSALVASRLSPLASYTGQLYDADAGLMYYRARWYDPVLGKFLNDDPKGFAAGDVNVSRYVGNGVLHRIDPSGLMGSSESGQSNDSTSRGGTGVPIVPFNKIGPGFPTVLPPVGQTTVVIGRNGPHTFLKFLNLNGQMTYVRGGPSESTVATLVVSTGIYGEGHEPYIPTKTLYHTVGNVPEQNLQQMTLLMNKLNAAQLNYSHQINNCNTTTCQMLEAMGLHVPSTPTPDPPRSTPGWGPTPRWEFKRKM
jgi:RHS repeat-associated protein